VRCKVSLTASYDMSESLLVDLGLRNGTRFVAFLTNQLTPEAQNEIWTF